MTTPCIGLASSGSPGISYPSPPFIQYPWPELPDPSGGGGGDPVCEWHQLLHQRHVLEVGRDVVVQGSHEDHGCRGPCKVKPLPGHWYYVRRRANQVNEEGYSQLSHHVGGKDLFGSGPEIRTGPCIVHGALPCIDIDHEFEFIRRIGDEDYDNGARTSRSQDEAGAMRDGRETRDEQERGSGMVSLMRAPRLLAASSPGSERAPGSQPLPTALFTIHGTHRTSCCHEARHARRGPPEPGDNVPWPEPSSSGRAAAVGSKIEYGSSVALHWNLFIPTLEKEDDEARMTNG
ncbi:hypothetical protein ACHAWF_010120 [Thalassiosira exigua]